MSVAPETTGKTSPKERCGRMKPLDFILTTLKAVVALTCFGLFLSNTIFIYSSKVDHDIVETNTEIEKLREDLQNLEHVQSIHDRSLKLVMTEQNTIMYNASCQQIWDEGERNNGLFMIQPSLDGVSFEVECEFTDTAATTVIHHRQSQQGITATPNQKDGCQDRGCFVDKITYSIDKAQVEALIYVSEQCEQEIQHTCYSNALTTYAFWHDRHGREIAYWNGDKTINETGCACYETNECENMEDFNIDRECNCDDMRANLTDFGVLTSMEQLPVTQLNYGGSSEIYAWIEYYLGPFKCTGRRNLYPSEVKSNSFEFKLATASNGEAVMQKNNPLVFDHVVYDHTLGYIENGTFYAPVDGFYRFEIQVLKRLTFFIRILLIIVINLWSARLLL